LNFQGDDDDAVRAARDLAPLAFAQLTEGAESLVNMTAGVDGIVVSNNTVLELFRFSSLANINASGNGILISSNSALQTVDFTSLVSIVGGTAALSVVSNNALTNFTFPSLHSVSSSGLNDASDWAVL
jgi:hypothetical protein